MLEAEKNNRDLITLNNFAETCNAMSRILDGDKAENVSVIQEAEALFQIRVGVGKVTKEGGNSFNECFDFLNSFLKLLQGRYENHKA